MANFYLSFKFEFFVVVSISFFSLVSIAQINVDGIVFGATIDSHSHTFAKEMKKMFEISMIGELSYFLGLHVQQLNLGMFVSPANYAMELVKINWP